MARRAGTATERTPALSRVIAGLEAQYGKPAPPRVRDPFGMIVLENAAYLVDDERRYEVFEALKQKVGIDPESFLALPAAALAESIARGGMHPERRAEKLHQCAEIARGIGLAKLARAVRQSSGEAKMLLQRFPGIGPPAADRILLFGHAAKSLAPDSNSLRVLVRLGFGRADASYARTYQSVAEAVAPQLTEEFAWLIRAHQLLRQHGRTLCKEESPRCDRCPVTRHCRWYRERVAPARAGGEAGRG
jgi:endonuclease-3